MDILFAILVILGPAIIKSVKEKKTAEEKRRYTPYNRPKERPIRMPNKPISVNNIEIEEENIEEENIEEVKTDTEKVKEIDMNKLEREYEELKSKVEDIPVYKERIKQRVESNKPKKSSYSLNELTKEDILKGIVLKEVLSEPKCMQNRMR